MVEKFVPPDRAKEIADALNDAMGALVELYDAETETYHLRMSTWWFSHRDHYDDRVPGGCRVSARINDRWMLVLSDRPFLHPDAQALATWGARQLEAHLPKLTYSNMRYPSPGRGGGSSGPAEIGIPISWLRKTRG